MSGREQNSDSYTPGMGSKGVRKTSNLKSGQNGNDEDIDDVLYKREVKEDKFGNVLEIGKKEAMNILTPEDKQTHLKLQRANQCDQKLGIYCSEFKMMMNLHKCVYIEQAENFKSWTAWVLLSPELDKLEFMKNINKDNQMEINAKVPFKGNRMLLKHCPNCGGDLTF